jgi:hypothetical protein
MPIRSAASSITVVTRNITSFVIVLLALPLMVRGCATCTLRSSSGLASSPCDPCLAKTMTNAAAALAANPRCCALQCWLKWGIFVLLAGAVLVSALLLFLTTPETKNVPLEQVSEVRGRLVCVLRGCCRCQVCRSAPRHAASRRPIASALSVPSVRCLNCCCLCPQLIESHWLWRRIGAVSTRSSSVQAQVPRCQSDASVMLDDVLGRAGSALRVP